LCVNMANPATHSRFGSETVINPFSTNLAYCKEGGGVVAGEMPVNYIRVSALGPSGTALYEVSEEGNWDNAVLTVSTISIMPAKAVA
jgi:hypothetical protein